MPDQAVDGGIAPVGEITNITIEADNPAGTITPFGTMNWSADFHLQSPDLGGEINPFGDLYITDDALCVPASFNCVAEPVTNYNCVDTCEPIVVDRPPSIDLGGIIIPVGGLNQTTSGCIPHDNGAVVSQTELNQFWTGDWFKQVGFFQVRAYVDGTHWMNESTLGSAIHTIGDPTFHYGPNAPQLPESYTVSCSFFMGTGGPFNTDLSIVDGPCVLGHMPSDTPFFTATGYYFGYNLAFGKLRICRLHTSGNTVLIEQDGIDSSLFNTMVEFSLRIENLNDGSVQLTGYLNGVQQLDVNDNDTLKLTESGRVGAALPWRNDGNGYMHGPFSVFSLDPQPIGYIWDDMIGVVGESLENHNVQYPQGESLVSWGDVGTLESLQLKAHADTITRDVYRERLITGLTPNTTVAIRGTMTLDRGSVTSGYLFGIRVKGSTLDNYFTDIIGATGLAPITFNLIIPVDDSGEVAIQYGAFGDGTPVPAGHEWDAGEYLWNFTIDELVTLDDCGS